MEVSSESEMLLIQKIKNILSGFNPDKKVTILQDFITAPIFDYQLLYDMLINELKKKSSVVAHSFSDDVHHHPPRDQERNKSSSVIGLKLRFKVRQNPPVPIFSAPENSNVVVMNQKPRRSRPDVEDYFDDDQHEKIKAAAAPTMSSLDKNQNLILTIQNQNPIVGNPPTIGPKFSKPNLGNDQQDKNNLMKNQKPIVGNHLKIVLKRPRIDLDEYYNHDEEEKGRAEKKKKKKTRPVVGCCVSMPQELEQVMKRVNGYDPVLVIQKSLYPSDVNPGLARLSMPLRQVNSRFLTEQEKDKLSKDERIEADMYEPCGEQCVIALTKWKMTKSLIYNLIKTWKDVVTRNCLKEGTLVQLWSFRRVGGGELCLFLAKM